MPALTPNHTVNLALGYVRTEPAPMGVADYGIDQYGNAYNYTTSGLVGEFDPISFGTFNASLGGDPTSASIQLNAMIVFEVSGITYVYWTQDFAVVDSNADTVAFGNNVWNASSPNSSMYSSSITGQGQVQTSNGVGFYVYADSEVFPFSTAYPILFRMQVGTTNGLPTVAFGFTVNNQPSVTYDTVTFPFVGASLGYGPLYRVDGGAYTPSGLYYDVELILGGPGNSASTMATANLDTEMAIRYSNGHNLQTPQNEFNYGSDTAETISGVVDQSVPNGDVDFASLTYGDGSLGQLFDMSGMVRLDLSGPGMSSGTVFLNSSSYNGTVEQLFRGGEWTQTVLPYSYDLTVLSGGVSYTFPPIDCQAGYTHVTVEGGAADSHTVAFVANGLPAGGSWSVALGGYSGTTTGPYIEFAGATVGPYSFTVVPPATYTANPSSGNVTVTGNDVLEPIAIVGPGGVSGSCPVLGPFDLGFLGLPCTTAYTLFVIVVAAIIGACALAAARSHRSRVARRQRKAALSALPTAASPPPPPASNVPPAAGGWPLPPPPPPPPPATATPLGPSALPPSPLPPPPPPPGSVETTPAASSPPPPAAIPPVTAGAALLTPPPVSQTHPPWSYCPACGQVVEDPSDRFCRACGRRRF